MHQISFIRVAVAIIRPFFLQRMSSNRKRHSSDTSPSTSDFEEDLAGGNEQSSRAPPVGESTKRQKKADDAENVEDRTKEDEKLSEERIIQTMDAKTCLNLLSSMTATEVVPYHPKAGHKYVYKWSSDQDFDGTLTVMETFLRAVYIFATNFK